MNIKRMIASLLLGALVALGTAYGASDPQADLKAGPATLKVFDVEQGTYVMTEKIAKTKDEWQKQLSPEQYKILREKGTERAFSGKYWNNHNHGIYRCAGCGLDLFSSSTKYDSGTGWPSFTAPVADENVATEIDDSWFMRRIEVHCPRCGGHLGHVFNDGPAPQGLRYCINSASLDFVEQKEDKQ